MLYPLEELPSLFPLRSSLVLQMGPMLFVLPTQPNPPPPPPPPSIVSARYSTFTFHAAMQPLLPKLHLLAELPLFSVRIPGNATIILHVASLRVPPLHSTQWQCNHHSPPRVPCSWQCNHQSPHSVPCQCNHCSPHSVPWQYNHHSLHIIPWQCNYHAPYSVSCQYNHNSSCSML